MKGVSDKARRRRLVVILLMPLCVGIVLRWPTEVWGYLHFYRALHLGTIPIPESIGVYAIKDGTLVRFNNDSTSPDFDSSVEFIFYSEVSRYSAGQWAIWRILPQIEPVPLQQGQPLWTQWLGALERFGREGSGQIQWAASNPEPAIKCWVRSVPGQRAMVRITPRFPPGPGLYLLAGVDTPTNNKFYIQREKLCEKYASVVTNALEEKRWAEGLHAAELSCAYGSTDSHAVGEIRVRLAAKIAREAMSVNRWSDAERAISVAKELRDNDVEINEIQTEMGYIKALELTRTAISKEDWDEAVIQCEKALTARPHDTQAEALYEKIPRVPFPGPKQVVIRTGFSTDGNTVFTLGRGFQLTTWNWVSREPLKSFQFDSSLRTILGNPDLSQWCGMEGERLVHLNLNTKTKNIILGRKFTLNRDWAVQQLAINGEGTILAIEKRWKEEELAELGLLDRFVAMTSAPYGNGILIWDLAQQKVLSLLAPAAKRPYFTSLVFSPGSRELLAVKEEGNIDIFSLASGQVIRTLATGIKDYNLSLHPDRRHVVCSTDTQVKVFSLATGRVVVDFNALDSKIKNFSLSKNMKLLAIGSEQAFQLWEMNPTRQRRTLREGDGVSIHDLSFSPDGRWLVVASNRDQSPLGLWRLTQEEQALAQMVIEEPVDATPEATLTETPLPVPEPTPTEAQIAASASESMPSESATVSGVTETAVPDDGRAALTKMLQSVGANNKLMPVDEGLSDPGFAEFRGKLVRTVEKRDTATLLSVVAENILNTAGEERGKQSFRELWKPENPKSEVWRQLGDILKLGGRFDSAKTTFTAPFVYTELRPTADQTQEIGVILGEGVSLRSAPSAKSRLVEKRSHEIVKLEFGESPWFEDQDGAEYPWFGITLPGGKTAFVSGRFVRCPLDYHAKFEKKGDTWRLTEFACEWPLGE